MTIGGKPVQTLERAAAQHRWQVAMLGSRAGDERVELRPDSNHPQLNEFDVPADLKRRGVAIQER